MRDEQPAPIKSRESVIDWLIERLKERRECAIATSGRELEPVNGGDVARDVWEEALDLLVSLSQQRMEQAERNRRYMVLLRAIRDIAALTILVDELDDAIELAEEALRHAGETL